MRVRDDTRRRADRAGRLMDCRGLGVWLAVALVAGCSANSDARDASGSAGARPEATSAAFLQSYEAGFQQGIADGKAEPRSAAALESPDHDFGARWRALSGLDVPDVDAFVRSGAADAWLDRRYRSLGFRARDLDSANALLFLANWEAFSGNTASRDQAAGVLRQIRGATGGARSQESATALEVRRRIYELMAATLARESERARAANAERIESFTETVRTDFLRMSNNDLADFNLTADGFEER